MIAWIVCAVGAAALAAGIAVNPAQAYFSYVTAYIFGLEIVLGALLFAIIEELIASIWFVAIRRTVETVASALPIFVPLFLPIVLGVHSLYPWTHPAMLDEHARGLVELKTGYLNLPFFFIRAAIYFVCWIAIAERLRRLSLQQDISPGARWNAAARATAAPGAVVVGFTFAFASIDWVMSLAPAWFSTMFSVQIFAGAMLCALALLAGVMSVPRVGAASEAATGEHRAAMGKMILTFAIFWAYTTFMQLLIVWIADLPDEATWYLPRTHGAWLVLGLAIAVFEFVIPFALMLSYALKRRARVMRWVAVCVVLGHYLEMYWTVMPQLHAAAPHPHWLDAAALATVCGAGAGLAQLRARRHAPIAIGDPALNASMRYSES